MEETHGKGRQWYGFTENQVFGEVMSDREICKYILQMLLPDRVIDEIYYPLKQKEIKDPSHRHEKDVRLDILVEDNHHNLYDLEMQTTDKRDLGKRLRYYGSQLDQRYTLKKGDTYKNLQNRKVFVLRMLRGDFSFDDALYVLVKIFGRAFTAEHFQHHAAAHGRDVLG